MWSKLIFCKTSLFPPSNLIDFCLPYWVESVALVWGLLLPQLWSTLRRIERPLFSVYSWPYIPSLRTHPLLPSFQLLKRHNSLHTKAELVQTKFAVNMAQAVKTAALNHQQSIIVITMNEWRYDLIVVGGSLERAFHHIEVV